MERERERERERDSGGMNPYPSYQVIHTRVVAIEPPMKMQNTEMIMTRSGITYVQQILSQERGRERERGRPGGEGRVQGKTGGGRHSGEEGVEQDTLLLRE